MSHSSPVQSTVFTRPEQAQVPHSNHNAPDSNIKDETAQGDDDSADNNDNSIEGSTTAATTTTAPAHARPATSATLCTIWADTPLTPRTAQYTMSVTAPPAAATERPVLPRTTPTTAVTATATRPSPPNHPPTPFPLSHSCKSPALYSTSDRRVQPTTIPFFKPTQNTLTRCRAPFPFIS